MAKILIIDDIALMRRLIRQVLQVAGYEVLCASDGEAGLDKIRAEKPDLVIMDWNMPQVNGLQVLRALRANPDTCSLPVVIASAHLEAADIVEMRAAGADGFISKPFQYKQLLATVRQHLEKARSGDLQITLDSLDNDTAQGPRVASAVLD